MLFANTEAAGIHRVLTFRNNGRMPHDDFLRIVLDTHRRLVKAQRERKELLAQVEYGSLCPHLDPLHEKRPREDASTIPADARDPLLGSVVPNGEWHGHSYIALHFKSRRKMEQFYGTDDFKLVRQTLYRDILTALGEYEEGEEGEALLAGVMRVGTPYVLRRTYTDQHDLDVYLRKLGG